MPLGMEVGLVPGYIVLDGDPAPPPNRGTPPPIFGPCLLLPNGSRRHSVPTVRVPPKLRVPLP